MSTSKQPRIRWWVVKGSNQLTFQEKLQEKGAWDLEGDTNVTWKKISSCIKIVATVGLGVLKI